MQLFLLVFRQRGCASPKPRSPTMLKKTVRVFILVLSGLSCCVGFSVVCFLLFVRKRVLFLAVWAGAWTLPRQKKKTRTCPNSKKKHAPDPSERVRSCFLGGWAWSCLCCLGGWLFFLGGVHVVSAGALFRRVRVFVFCCLGNGFCCLGGGSCVFLLFGRGA